MVKIIKHYYYFIFLILFIYLMIGVYNDWFINIDLKIYQFSQLFYSETMTTILKGITFFGSAPWLIFLILLLVVLLKEKLHQLFLIAVMVIEEGINLLLKYLVQRPRPTFLHLVTENSFSFPSGHAMGSTAFYGVCLYLVWQSNIPKKYKMVITIVGCLLVLLIGFSRIYLGVHYFSDIIAGCCLSLFLLLWLNDVGNKTFLNV